MVSSVTPITGDRLLPALSLAKFQAYVKANWGNGGFNKEVGDVITGLMQIDAYPEQMKTLGAAITHLQNLRGLRDLSIMSLGLGGENGEVLEHVKKNIRDGKPLHTVEMLAELGDQLHYLVRIIQEAGFTVEEVMAANVDKLDQRFGRPSAV